MELKEALTRQYRASLMQLREAIEKCPDEAWTGGTHPRNPWRIAYHVLHYTHLYSMRTMDEFEPWEKNRPECRFTWETETGPPVEPAFSRTEILEYLTLVEGNIDGWMAAMDLDADHSGIPWYDMTKLEHQLVNLRHLNIHIGQLQEIVYATGGDLDWVGSA